MSEESKPDVKPVSTPPTSKSGNKPTTIQDIRMEAPVKLTLDKIEMLKFQAILSESKLNSQK